MTDIVKRLRTYRSYNDFGDAVRHDICEEAAAEIERLRIAMTKPDEPLVTAADYANAYAVEQNMGHLNDGHPLIRAFEQVRLAAYLKALIYREEPHHG